MVKETPFSGPDRALGAGFGLLRGAVIVVALVLLASLTPVKQDPWWSQSFLIARAEPAAEWVRQRLPPEWFEVLQPEVLPGTLPAVPGATPPEETTTPAVSERS